MKFSNPLAQNNYSRIFLTCESFTKKYKIHAKLGEGHSANVFKIENLKTNKTFALKTFNHRNPKSNLHPERHAFLREKLIFDQIASVLDKRHFSHIVSIVGAFREKTEQFLILELMRGTLRDSSLKIADIPQILLEIGIALKALHAHNFAHLDVSPGELTRKYSLCNSSTAEKRNSPVGFGDFANNPRRVQKNEKIRSSQK